MVLLLRSPAPPQLSLLLFRLLYKRAQIFVKVKMKMKTFFNLKQTQSFSAFQEISCTFVGESVQNLGLNYPRGAFFLFLCGAHRMSLTLEGRRCYYKHRVPPTQSPFLWAVGEQLGYRGAVAATLLLRRASLGASAGQVAKRDFST